MCWSRDASIVSPAGCPGTWNSFLAPDAAATLWGSSWGRYCGGMEEMWAAKVAERAEKTGRARVDSRNGRSDIFFPEELCGLYGYPSNGSDGPDSDEESDKLTLTIGTRLKRPQNILLGRINLLNGRVHRIDAVLAVLGADALEAYFSLETELNPLWRP